MDDFPGSSLGMFREPGMFGLAAAWEAVQTHDPDETLRWFRDSSGLPDYVGALREFEEFLRFYVSMRDWAREARDRLAHHDPDLAARCPANALTDGPTRRERVVRDQVAARIRREGGAVRRVTSPREAFEVLRLKLVEEAGELSRTPNPFRVEATTLASDVESDPVEARRELADVCEVAQELASMLFGEHVGGWDDYDTLQDLMSRKRAEVGGFRNRELTVPEESGHGCPSCGRDLGVVISPEVVAVTVKCDGCSRSVRVARDGVTITHDPERAGPRLL